MKIYAKILELVLAIAVVIGAWMYSGHVAVEDYKKDQEIAQGKADKAQQDKYDKLASDYEALRTKREDNAKVIVRQVEKVVAGDVVYRNICINDSGLSLANSAITGSSVSIPDAALQATE